MSVQCVDLLYLMGLFFHYRTIVCRSTVSDECAVCRSTVSDGSVFPL